MTGLQPHVTFRLFEETWPRTQHTLMYCSHDETNFPIGLIGGGPISADQARRVIEDKCGDYDGPILHLALAPHTDPPDGVGHAMTHLVDQLPSSHTTLNGDAIIVTDLSRPFAIETLLGDCACIIVASPRAIGFIHAGTPELFADPSIFDSFRDHWPSAMCSSLIFLGPVITGKHYAYNPEKVPEHLAGFIIDPGETLFGESGFDLAGAIRRELNNWGISPDLLADCEIDPFQQNLDGEHQWASARYARYLQTRNLGDGLSPRDCAFFTYRPDPATC